MSDYILLVELELDSGTVYLSPTGEQLPSGWYEDALLGVDRIEREIALLPGELRVSSCNITVSNVNNLVSKLKAEPMRNRTVRIKCGLRSAGISELTTIFTGAIESVTISADSATISVRDSRLDVFSLLPMPRISTSIFPDLPATTPRHMVPVIYGNMSLYSAGGAGAVRCYRVTDSSPYKYLVAGHRCKGVDYVYVHGSLVTSGYSVVEETYAGRTCTLLSFTSDPRGGELPDDDEVTADVRGVMDESDDLIENPVEQLRHFLEDVVGLGASGIDDDSFDTASTVAETYSYVGAAWIGEDKKSIDIINNFARSFTMPFFLSRDGKASVKLLVASDLIAPPTAPSVTDATDVLSGSLTIKSNEDVASGLGYRLVYDPVRGDYLDLQRQDTPGEDERLGEEIIQELELPYVRDVATAHRVAATRLMFHVESREHVSFSLPPEYMDLELAEHVLLTHFAGVAADGGGYVEAPCLISGLSTSLGLSDMRVDVHATHIPIEYEHADSHADDHTDVSHVDVAHSNTAHSNSHTDQAYVDEAHEDYHLDEHSDSHSDQAHSDASHGDFHGDAAHIDVPYSDSHGDSHTDVAHSDTAHADTPHYDQYYDLHEDVHGDYSNGEHLDEHSDEHIDYYIDEHSDVEHGDAHSDEYTDWHTDQPHSDGPHNDWHSDTEHLDTQHEDSHVDVPHGDAHSDVAHTDSHGDSYSDVPHSDVAYQDAEHGDTPHHDFHADSDSHEDTHADSYADESHTDNTHGDESHTDNTHLDGTHTDNIHSDTHGDVPHANSHSDVAHTDCDEYSHQDGYIDEPHYNVYYDGTHFDNSSCEHADWYTDTSSGSGHYYIDAHYDQHFDVSHEDTHSDSHTDTHEDSETHGDTHSDEVIHGDTHTDEYTHGDTHSDSHEDTHEDHLDIFDDGGA